MSADRLEHEGNLLGALALVITDRTSGAMAAAAGVSESAATALSALHHFLDRPTIDRLRQVLGLTSSGAVRLVDKLVAAGYVRRQDGEDGRSVAVTLTSSGRAAAKRISAARAGVLADALSGLSPAQRASMDELLGTVLAGLIRGPGATKWLCRQCDLAACRRDDGQCPVAEAVRIRYLS